MTKMTFSECVDSIHRAVSELSMQVAAMKLAAERVGALSRTDAELYPLLLELAAAEKDMREHYVRHPNVREIGPGESAYQRAADPVACEADWRRVCRRRDAAVSALTQYAIAIAEKVARETEAA